MLDILKQKEKYFSPEIETVDFLSQDIVTASNEGASDGNGDGSNLDNSAWT